MRKNTTLWKKWNHKLGLGIHKLQWIIARRGAEVLKVGPLGMSEIWNAEDGAQPGGFMVYSTCSFNPVENEAVVAQLLRHFGDDLELVDTKDKLPGLERLPGLRTWKIQDDDGTWYTSFDQVPQARKRKILQSMFPPSSEESDKFHLERSMRIAPYSQDSGGFFIALLKKSERARAKGSRVVEVEADAEADEAAKEAKAVLIEAGDEAETEQKHTVIPESESGAYIPIKEQLWNDIK